MARLSFRCGDELVAAVDVARGDVARERWLRRVVERALGLGPGGVGVPGGPAAGRAEAQAVPSPAPAEQREFRLPAEEPRVLSRTEMFRRATQGRGR